MAKDRQADRLKDGVYKASCKEATKMKALVNGHGAVWPEADLAVRDGWAFFTRDGVAVWDCNGGYAAAHFNVTPVKP